MGAVLQSASVRTSARAPSADRGRRIVAALVLLTYLLLVVEGALRKWALPQYSQLLFFVRDPFVLAAYLVALRYGLWPRHPVVAIAGATLAAAATLMVVLQTAMPATIGGNPLLLAAYGARNYFFYLPLAFLTGAVLSWRDLRRLYAVVLLLAVPMAALVAIQFNAPIDARINVGTATALEQQFRGLGLTGDRTRPMGTFTSDIGQRLFTLSALAIAVGLWILPAGRRGVARPLLVAGTLAAATCLALSGSRGAILHAGLVLGGAALAAVFLRRGVLIARTLVWPMLLLVASVLLYPIVYPEGYAAFVERWESAQAAEREVFRTGVFGRALYGFVDFTRLLGAVPLAGLGLGLGGNASTTLGITIDGALPISVAETDWARHVVDLGPVVGLGYIAFRCVLVAWLAVLAVRAARRHEDPMPIVLLSFLGFELLTGQITGHGSVNGFAWLFCGVLLAAVRTAGGDGQVVLSARGPVAPRFPHLLR